MGKSGRLDSGPFFVSGGQFCSEAQKPPEESFACLSRPREPANGRTYIGHEMAGNGAPSSDGMIGVGRS